MSLTTVLVAGSTGLVGSHITRELLNNKAYENVRVKLLIRQESESKVQEWVDLGAEIVRGDLTTSTISDLSTGLKGVDVVVSAVSGSPDVYLDGQLKLLEAAKQAGVTKFIPSDYFLDFFKLEEGHSIALDLNRKVAEEVKKSGLDYVFVAFGTFYEYIVHPNFIYIDLPNDRVDYYGDLDVRLDITRVSDAAKFVAQIAVRSEIKNRSIHVRGDDKSLREIIHLYEDVAHKKLTVEKKGELNDLKKKILETSPGDDLIAYIFQEFQWVLSSGKTKFHTIDNELFPNVQTQSLKQFFQELYA